MNRAQQCFRTINQRRPGRIQQLIGNHQHSPPTNRWHALPRRNSVSLTNLRPRPRSRPRQHNYIRCNLCHLLVRNPLARRQNHLSSSHPHQLRHPRRRTDPRIRPSLTVNAHCSSTFQPRFCPPRHRLQSSPRLPNHPLSRRSPPHNSRQQSNVALHVRQRPRIHRQKTHRLGQNLRHRLLLVRHRPNHQRRPQLHDFRYVPHMPAIPNLRQPAHIRHVATPLRHAHQRPPRSDFTQDRCGTWRQRDDSWLSLQSI